jgi:acetoin utilization protein AcuB
MLVANRMAKNPVTASPRDLLAEAEVRMNSGNFRHLPVTDNGKLVGMLSDADIRQHQGHLKDTRVSGAMTENPITVAADTTMEEAAEIMLERKISGLPVVDKGNLVGIITTADLLGAFLEIFGTTEENASRLDIMLDESGPRDLPTASQVIHNAGGEILGLGTYRDRWNEERVYYLVIRAGSMKPVMDALGGKDFRVLGMH